MPSKKIILFFLCCIVQAQVLLAQTNLVIDGSFEELITPLNNPACIDFSDIKKWSNPNNLHAHYYNQKSTYHMCSPRYNYVYYRTPREGDGVMGLYVVQDEYPDISRCYVQGELYSQLKTAKKYQVSFYVSLANWFGMSISTIGALLTTEPITFTNRCELEPQVESNWHLTDTLNWMEIKGEFVAQGNEQYITIGNFRTDAESDTLRVETGVPSNVTKVGYYILDDVSVVCMDCDVGIAEQNQDQKNVFYNISNNTLNVSTRGNLLIYNMQGAKVLEQNIKQEENIVLPQLAKGVYVWQLQTENEVTRGKFVVSE